MSKTNLLVATEMPSGMRSKGYHKFKDEEMATKWFESVLRQMKEFKIPGSSVLMFAGETEVMREITCASITQK